MKRLLGFGFVVFALAACSSATQQAAASGGSAASGAASPRQAVSAFLGAAKAQDLRAMALVWGTKDGPARDVVDKSQLEKRELIMQCYVNHDTFAIQNESPGEAGTRVLSVALSKGTLTRQTTFTTVQGPGARWYVRDLQLEPLKDLCATS